MLRKWTLFCQMCNFVENLGSKAFLLPTLLAFLYTLILLHRTCKKQKAELKYVNTERIYLYCLRTV